MAKQRVTEFEEVLIRRDGMTKSEAKRERERATEMLNEVLSEGGGYDDVEEMLNYEYGLEMDYIFDLL